ncbi:MULTISPECIES: hypothetical protein [unclassified Guyparkeria]|uniref:hypothetical protein n=1 Tax=unclassified Guyparkeria TaxID=2626246 RepID=UPI0007336887|nr:MULTISPECIES: hypothetical protein [unclassified Guyparkeria]KTG16271.1 hypothetical protein AUR63_05445 [Guyparkeria sp. XI15]OAE85122.1 hypothetical protein AWR35_05455 [Guyparkeria sp. WRN-7]
MADSTRPVVELSILGLQPRDGRPDDGSGFSSPTWTWPDDDAERPLARLLSRRYLAPSAHDEGEADCRFEDPDRQALGILEADPPAEIDALTRALGDWCLGGGSRESFHERIEAWKAEGFTQLLCFDPIHLKAETDHAITLGPRFLALTAEELDGLIGEMNAWLAQDGMRVERIGRQLYLLARAGEGGVGPANVDLKRAGAPLACLLNRNAGVFLDEHHSDPILRQWLTEVQMWLYPQPFNDERAGRGQPILNSFWPHGMAELTYPLHDEATEAGLIVSDSPAVLARHDALAFEDASPRSLREAIEAGRSLHVVLSEAAWCRLEGDLGGFQRELARIDDWLAGLLESVPGLNVRLLDGQGGVWRRENYLARLWQRLWTGWRRRA